MFKSTKHQAQQRAKELEIPFTTIDPTNFLETFYKENEYNTKSKIILNQYTTLMLKIVNEMARCLPVDKIEKNEEGIYTMDNDKHLFELTKQFEYSKQCALSKLREELKFSHISLLGAYTNKEQDTAFDNITSYMCEIDAIRKAELTSMTVGKLIQPAEKMRRICEYVANLQETQLSETSGCFPACENQNEPQGSNIVFHYTNKDYSDQHDTVQTLSPKLTVANNTTTTYQGNTFENSGSLTEIYQVSTTDSEQHDTNQTLSPSIYSK